MRAVPEVTAVATAFLALTRSTPGESLLHCTGLVGRRAAWPSCTRATSRKLSPTSSPAGGGRMLTARIIPGGVAWSTAEDLPPTREPLPELTNVVRDPARANRLSSAR